MTAWRICTTSPPSEDRMAAPRIRSVSASTTSFISPAVSSRSMARATQAIGILPTLSRRPGRGPTPVGLARCGPRPPAPYRRTPRPTNAQLSSWPALLLGRKLLEHIPEFAVELVRLLQHRVVAEAVDGDRPEVGVLLVGFDDRGGEGLVSAGGVDAPHRHLGLQEQLPRVEAEEVVHEGDRHLRVLTFGL